LSIDINIGVFGVSEVHTLINTRWGQPAPSSYAYIEFFGSDSAYYRKDLLGNVDVRDYANNNWTNGINGTSTTNVVLVENGYHRLDKQCITLPSVFLSQKLDRIDSV